MRGDISPFLGWHKIQRRLVRLFRPAPRPFKVMYASVKSTMCAYACEREIRREAKTGKSARRRKTRQLVERFSFSSGWLENFARPTFQGNMGIFRDGKSPAVSPHLHFTVCTRINERKTPIALAYLSADMTGCLFVSARSSSPSKVFPEMWRRHVLQLTKQTRKWALRGLYYPYYSLLKST